MQSVVLQKGIISKPLIPICVIELMTGENVNGLNARHPIKAE